jgi:hypothetical protein
MQIRGLLCVGCVQVMERRDSGRDQWSNSSLAGIEIEQPCSCAVSGIRPIYSRNQVGQPRRARPN